MKKHTLWSRLLSLFRFLLATIFLFGLVGAGIYWQCVVENPGAHIKKNSILAVIAQESPIYYRDFDPSAEHQQPIGTLFSNHHRQYVPWEELPQFWIDAIVASEDQRFFSHYGISPFGILRAMKHNIRAGRVVAGGSTLTQQTAKNLFARPDRSFSSKATEALNALRLEYYYDKEQILEFYANQFHVNANGRGLGIAARYFFNSSVSDLSLVQCAFIAGMVKGPNLYDPFNKNSPEHRERALERAHLRTAYVLERMYSLEKISSEEYKAAMDVVEARKLPFSKGVFRYDNNVITQEVIKRLESPSFQKQLQLWGIDDVSTAGLQIVTTIDKQTQERALYGLRTHLARLGPSLSKAKTSLMVASSLYTDIPLEIPPQPFSFHYAKVTSKKDSEIRLDVRGHECVVDKKQIAQITSSLGQKKQALQKQIDVGSVVFVAIDENGACVVQVQHNLEGGVLAVQNGAIVAMVGGQSNKDLNRALDSERQLGSVWKTLVYAAALQLGWTQFDALDNVHNAFYFERGWYFPRAAHKSEDVLSMNWVGAQSENIASVWLLYHLTAQLSVAQLEELARIVGLARIPEETEQAYRIRIRDTYGVISTNGDLDQIAFHHAKKEVLSKLDDDVRTPLVSLLFGGSALEERRAKNNKAEIVGLEHSWVRIQKRKQSCDEAYAKLKEFVATQDSLHYNFFQLDAPEAAQIDPSVRDMFWMGDGFVGCGYSHREKTPLPSMETWKEVPPMRYDGYFPVEVWDELVHKQKKYKLLYQQMDGYSLARLVHHQDFLFVLHARYLSLLAKQTGLEKKMSISLSLPLGVTDITLADSIALYEGILTGQRHESTMEEGFRLIDKIYYNPHPFSDTPSNPILLYEASSQATEIAHEQSGKRTLEILNQVVQQGTGQRAKEGILGFPAFGKTGTTNKSMNAAFCGVVPSFEDGVWSFRQGLFISSYVGFDQPQPMNRRGYGVSGASGALPIWIETAKGAIQAGLLGDAPHTQWNGGAGFTRVLLDGSTGLPSVEGTIVGYDELDGKGEAVRYFAPVRVGEDVHDEPLEFFSQVAEDTGADTLLYPEN